MTTLNKSQIIELLPHREPMLLIDELYDIKKLHSASALVNVRKDSFFVQGHFPDQPVMPGVLIVESFGQAAAALTAHGLDKSTYENKLVFLMGVEKARFRNPVIPDCKLILKIEAIRSHGRVWKYKGEAFVDDTKMADAIWSATIVADHTASAILVSLTKASPLYFHTRPWDLIASISSMSLQSGITGFLNLAFSAPIKKTNLSL